MELTQLLAPNGLYHKVWLAAHWDRKLKKQDYNEINLTGVISSILDNEQIVSLRTAGHLLFGICKVFQKKFVVFEENAKELNTRLMMAFTTERSRQADPRVGISFLQKMDFNHLLRPAAENEELQLLQTGQRYVARLEDITLRPLLAPNNDAAHFGNFDLLSELTMAEEQDIAALLLRLPQPEEVAAQGLFESQQPLGLVESMPQDGLVAGLPPVGPEAADSAGMLNIDAPDDVQMPLHEEGNFLSDGDGVEGFKPQEEKKDADVDGTQDLLVEPPVKRRRRAWMFDEETQISKSEYQQYVQDRSKITQPNLPDFDIVLPHVVPTMPDFITTFTDMCPALVDLIKNGSKESEKQRQTLIKLENEGHLPEVANPAPGEETGSPPSAREDVAGTPEAAHSQLADSSLGSGGLRSQDHHAAQPGSPALSTATAASSRAPPTEELLLRHPPPDMSSVLVPRPIDEDTSFDARRWTGYSQRSEKMHSFLAKEFRDTGEIELSFQEMCESQPQARRDAMAGCFFELLVLKTNGVIELEQDDPEAEIKISKASKWSSSRTN